MSHAGSDQTDEIPPYAPVKKQVIPAQEPGTVVQKLHGSQPTPPGLTTGKKMFLVRGNTMIPVTALSRSPQPFKATGSGDPSKSAVIQSLPQLKEVKNEPIDEDPVTAMANITYEKPLNLEDLLPKASPSSDPKHITNRSIISSLFKKISPAQKQKRNNTTHSPEEADANLQDDRQPSTSSAVPQNVKRSRKPTKRDEYVYGTHDDEEMQEEPVKKKARFAEQPEGCRCEYIVPELEKKMDRMMEKIRIIETLAKTLSVQASQRDTEDRDKNEEIQRLKLQLDEYRAHPPR